MGELHLGRGLLKWGNAYGIRITKAEADSLGAREKQPLDIIVRTEAPSIDTGSLPFTRLGGDASRRHTELAEEGIDAGY